MSPEPYDLAGVGIGPFNLGLAALSATVPRQRAIFFERSSSFDWHRGMMIDGASMQVSFLADLVTLVDPANPYGFLCYLKASGRLHRFLIRERHIVSRREYNRYCQWVAGQLPSLRFAHDVLSVEYDTHVGAYRLATRDLSRQQTHVLWARNVVLGVGSVPAFPACTSKRSSARVFHASEYVQRKEDALSNEDLVGHGEVTVVGSGQSAAEIVYDLMRSKQGRGRVSWMTRSDRFAPMDTSKFAQELVSPDYVEHFTGLDPRAREVSLSSQELLYRGVNASLLGDIYELLYEHSIDDCSEDFLMAPQCELERIVETERGVQASFLQRQTGQRFEHLTDVLILATGYQVRVPTCLDPLQSQVRWDERGRYLVDKSYAIACEHGGLYVQNAEMHSHGIAASDLSMGPHRNAVILNAILGREHFLLERSVAFQQFGDLTRRPSLRARERTTSRGDKRTEQTTTPRQRP